MNGWPNWMGATVAILATGASLPSMDLAPLRGRARVIAIKSAVRLAPWCDMVYGADFGWWLENVRMMVAFQGLKVSPSPTVCRTIPDVMSVWLRPVADVIVAPPGVIGCGQAGGGGHSGFQAMNLAVQLGAVRILLLGYDMEGARFMEEPGVGVLDPRRMEAHCQEMERTHKQFEILGVDVVNCTPNSRLKCFRCATLAEVLQ